MTTQQLSVRVRVEIARCGAVRWRFRLASLLVRIANRVLPGAISVVIG